MLEKQQMCIIYKQIYGIGHYVYILLMGYIVQKMSASDREQRIDSNFEVIVKIIASGSLAFQTIWFAKDFNILFSGKTNWPTLNLHFHLKVQPCSFSQVNRSFNFIFLFISTKM